MFLRSAFSGLSAAALACALTGAAFAQDGNVIIIEQISDGGGGNTLIVDQSKASNSLVAGVPSDNPFGLSNDPITDTGNFIVFGATAGGQNAVTTVSGDSRATQDGSLNSAVITLAGNGSFAGLEQFGVDNKATINVTGDFAGGIIVQDGDDNIGSVSVQENGGFGELIQLGDGNETSFAVSGSPDASVSWTIEGNNVSTSANIPASIVTNSGGQVTIVQRQLGRF